MFVNPFWFGVATTIVVELLLVFASAIISVLKDKYGRK